MASSRIVSRLLPTTLSCLSRMGTTNGSMRHFFYRNPRNLPDVFLGSTRNVFRDLEREFEHMQRQFDNYFRGSTENNNQSLVNHSRAVTNGKWFYIFESYIIILYSVHFQKMI